MVDLRAGYDLTDRISLAVNVNNLFDKSYYERVSGTEFGNFYGAPRNLLAAARVRYRCSDEASDGHAPTARSSQAHSPPHLQSRNDARQAVFA